MPMAHTGNVGRFFKHCLGNSWTVFATFPRPKLYTKILRLLYKIYVDVATFTSNETQDYLKIQGDFGYIFMQHSWHA